MEEHDEGASTWVFQANPDLFDINGYLAFAPKRMTWLVKQSPKRIKLGDQVFIWRALGKRKSGPAGIIAECRVDSAVLKIEEEPEAIPFWRRDGAAEPQPRVWLKVIRVADPSAVLSKDELVRHPELSRLEPITFANATNFRVKPAEVGPLNTLWQGLISPINAEKIGQTFDAEVRAFQELTLDELRARYEERKGRTSVTLPRKTEAASTVFERDPLVKALALERAKYKCEVPVCDNAPFLSSDGNPYCEVHHLTWLSAGGPDTPENVVCVCANHHRELHFGKDREVLVASLRDVRRKRP